MADERRGEKRLKFHYREIRRGDESRYEAIRRSHNQQPQQSVRWPRRWLTALAVSRLTRRKSKQAPSGEDQRSLEQSARSADDLADAKRPLNGEGRRFTDTTASE